MVLRTAFHNKIVNKTRRTRKSRKFRTPFWRQLSDKSSIKFLQDRIKNNSLMKVLELPLTYRVIQVNYIKAHYIQVVVKVNEPRYIALFVLSRSI